LGKHINQENNMTVPSGQFWGVDSYLSRFFILNADGSLQAVDTNPLEPTVIDGPRTFDLTPAESGLVVNIGNGRVRDTIYRSPREASRAELRVGYDQLDVIAALTGVKVYTIGEMKAIGRLTNRQGSEPDVAFLMTQRGHDENGLTRYKTYIIPKSKCPPSDASMNDNASEVRFPVTISNSKKEIWGESYNLTKHGFTDTGYLTFITNDVPHIVAWQGDGMEDTFLLPTDKPATDVAAMTVWNWNTGLQYVTGITKAVNQVEFDYPSTDLLIAVYEYEG
jgi:hypothetical protein